MSQHDYDIANQTAPNFRSDLNDALGAIATNNSGSTEPSVTYANQWWYDTSNNILKIRSEADDAWINVGYLDQSTNEFKPYVGGTQVDTQSTSTWESGTSTTEGIVSPAKVKAAVDAQLIFSEEYESSDQTFSAGGSLTLSHGLGSTPKLVLGILECTTAEGGYSVGDIVYIGPNSKPAAGNNYGFTSVVNGSSVFIRFGSDGNGFILLRKDNGGELLISPSSWAFRLKAWA